MRGSGARAGRVAGWIWALGSVLFVPGTPAAVRIPPAAPGPVKFAAAEIGRAAAESLAVDVALEVRGGEPQSYRIERDGARVRVIGGDAVGAMYGGLDVAEAIRLGALGALRSGEHRPYVAARGIKFNLPLDLRTPSFADGSDSAQANIPEVWSREFWREYFDAMARDRFNVLSLWSLNPFPSLVKVPEFPDVALNDVLRGRRRWFAGALPHSGLGNFQPAMLRGAEVVKRITIDGKIAFWRDVMQMAKDRGIDVYLYTWNAFLFTAEGQDGLTRRDPFGRMAEYFRASVRETVNTYPLLAGIGITAGENMSDLKGDAAEQWLWQTYGLGIQDALRTSPQRPFRLIHRLYATNLERTRRVWAHYSGPFDVSFKYAIAHMYGMTRPPFIAPLLPSLSPECRTWAELRNDDIYSFRWADAGYARAFIRALPGPDKLAGFNMGPDGYCWGREAMAVDPPTPRPLVMQKQWLSFLLWGRLSYDPTLPDDLFRRIVGARFPEAPAAALVAAWTAASGVIPAVNRFFWMPLDFKWLPEACWSSPKFRGFFTVRDFMEGSGMPESGDMSIRAWRRAALSGRPFDGLTPFQAAERLRADADAALAGAAALRARAASDRELRATLGDIEAMAWLGRYYAEKIEGAAELALFDATAQSDYRASALGHLGRALHDWREYAAAYTRQYRQPLLYGRVGVVDIPRLTENAAADIEIARAWKPGTVPNTLPARNDQD